VHGACSDKDVSALLGELEDDAAQLLCAAVRRQVGTLAMEERSERALCYSSMPCRRSLAHAALRAL
jgi:hypothetical protein